MTIKYIKTVNNIPIYTAYKDISDEKMEKLKNTYVKPSQIGFILDKSADIYTDDGELLIKFRKNILKTNPIDEFYDNIIDFAKSPTSNRGSASGADKGTISSGTNPEIMTNIIGYMDSFAPMQQLKLTRANKKMINVRECKFNRDNPEKYKKCLPLIKEIDTNYKKYLPNKYALQRKKSNQTPFNIPNTAFTTVTTNVNFRTAMHTDKGDDTDGFGNLTVIESGEYTGGETCFPQYGIGVDVRTGDLLFMNVHKIHGNLPTKFKTKDAIRLSIVCYLRMQIWIKTKGKSKAYLSRHNKTLKKIFKK